MRDIKLWLVIGLATAALVKWLYGGGHKTLLAGGTLNRLADVVEQGELRVEPVPFTALPTVCLMPVQQLQDLGFRLAGTVCTRPGTMPPQYTALLLDHDARSYARISALADSPGATCGVTSHLDEGRALDTSTSEEAVANPLHLSQLLPRALPAQVVDAHRRRLEALASQGVTSAPLAADDLLAIFRQSWIDDARGLKQFGRTRQST